MNPKPAAPKKSVPKKNSAPKPEKIKILAPIFGAIFLGGAFLGSLFFDVLRPAKNVFHQNGKTLVAVEDLAENMRAEIASGSEIIVSGGKTWMSVPGLPVELVVLNDQTCGQSCDRAAAPAVAQLRAASTPALLVRTVDVSSAEGKDLIKTFEINTIPAFIFGEGIKKLEHNGEKWTEKFAPLLVQSGEKYLVNNENAGFKVGQFIAPPKFDLENEPVFGAGGKITVVEFTDFQCPYCKRLHDLNVDLIEKLVAENKIQYVIKDYPLPFHPEAVWAQMAANAVLAQAGIEKYNEFKSKIFETQSVWSGAGDGGSQSHLQSLAAEIGVELADEVWQNADLRAELDADMAEAQKWGVSGTPALFIGRKIMPGAISPEMFEAAVDEELAARN